MAAVVWSLTFQMDDLLNLFSFCSFDTFCGLRLKDGINKVLLVLELSDAPQVLVSINFIVAQIS